MSWEKHTVPGTGIDFVDYSPWNRRTIADGTWLQNNTLAPIYHNEEILASAIYDSSAKLHVEISAASGSLKSKIKSSSAYLQSEIDTMKAATDVVDVVGSYPELLSYSAYITSGDIVKVLNCCATWGSGETYRTYSALNRMPMAGKTRYCQLPCVALTVLSTRCPMKSISHLSNTAARPRPTSIQATPSLSMQKRIKSSSKRFPSRTSSQVETSAEKSAVNGITISTTESENWTLPWTAVWMHST